MKGISELVGAILLIAIVIVIGTIIAIWGASFFQTQTGEASGCVSDTNYIIEEPTFNLTGQNEMRIRVTNFGDMGVYGFGVTVRNGTDVLVFGPGEVDQGGISQSAPLNKGESAYILVDMLGHSQMARNLVEVVVTNQACFDVSPALRIYRG